jgi:hypothetical protein
VLLFSLLLFSFSPNLSISATRYISNNNYIIHAVLAVVVVPALVVAVVVLNPCKT